MINEQELQLTKHEDLIVTVVHAYILLNRVIPSCQTLDPTLFRDIKKFLDDLAAKKD